MSGEKYTIEKRAEVWRDAKNILDLMDAEILSDLNYACHISDEWEHEQLQREADEKLVKIGDLARAIDALGLVKVAE